MRLPCEHFESSDGAVKKSLGGRAGEEQLTETCRLPAAWATGGPPPTSRWDVQPQTQGDGLQVSWRWALSSKSIGSGAQARGGGAFAERPWVQRNVKLANRLSTIWRPLEKR